MSREHINRYLFELLRRIEEGARRLASTITHNADKPLRDIALVDVEVTEIENALDQFKREVAADASVGAMSSCSLYNGTDETTDTNQRSCCVSLDSSGFCVAVSVPSLGRPPHKIGPVDRQNHFVW
jgi:hypothetical protein